MARSKTPSWMDHLPLVLLGIRTSVRQDLVWCPAELVYGATLRLPGEFLFPPDPDDAMMSPGTDFIARLRSALAATRPAPSVHHRPASRLPPGIPPSLAAMSHVFLQVDAVKRPLTRPYEGPFRVLKKEAKAFVICRGGKAWTVSVDRLKPAWGSFGAPVAAPLAPSAAPPSPAPSSVAGPSAVAPPAPVKTRSGRLSKPPERLDY